MQHRSGFARAFLVEMRLCSKNGNSRRRKEREMQSDTLRERGSCSWYRNNTFPITGRVCY